MRLTPVRHLTSVAGLAVAVALAVAGCGSAGGPSSDPGAVTPVVTSQTIGTSPPLVSPTDGTAMRVTMTGTIEDGVESGCLVFTDEASGETYSVTEELPHEVPAGERVSVSGTVDPDLMSFCMQGPVLLVDEVTETPG